MRRIVKSILAATLLAAAAASSASAQENYRPSPEIVAAQEQFRENRFGIFIHWGRPGRVGPELQRPDPRGVQQAGRGLLPC